MRTALARMFLGPSSYIIRLSPHEMGGFLVDLGGCPDEILIPKGSELVIGPDGDYAIYVSLEQKFPASSSQDEGGGLAGAGCKAAPARDTLDRGEVISEANRAAIDVMLKGFAATEALVAEQMAPFGPQNNHRLPATVERILGIIGEGRETLLEHYGVQPAGRCTKCDKLLFVGEMGARIGSEIVYCPDHAPTFADYRELWDRIELFNQTEEERLAREAFEDEIARHLVEGGAALTDKRLEELT